MGEPHSDEEWAERFRAEGLTDWFVRQSTAQASFGCASFAEAGALAARLARLCDEQGHHPEIDVRHPATVRVTTWTRDGGGLSEADVALAKAVSAAAATTS